MNTTTLINSISAVDDRQYYEICAMNELKGALRAGDIWGRGSRHYKNFDDYLIPRDDFEKLLNNNLLNLPVGTECGAYLNANTRPE